MKYWAFDLDGTLVDSFPHYFATLDKIFQLNGTRFTEEMRYPALTHPIHEFFEQHLGKNRVPQAVSKLRALSLADAPSVRAFGGMREALESLASQGARFAVWTNRDLASALPILDQTGLNRWVETCVSGTCVSQRKPHPEGLIRIIHHFGCEPSEIAVVGDHEYDMSGAKAAGARAIRASWHGYWSMPSCPIADAQFYGVRDFERWAQSAVTSGRDCP